MNPNNYYNSNLNNQYNPQYPNNNPYATSNINSNINSKINSNISPIQEDNKPLDFEEIILKVKPTLSKSSLKIYTTNLTKLYKYVNDTHDNEIKNLDFIYNSTKINKFLEDKALKTKANYYNNLMTLYSYVINIEKKEDPKIHKVFFQMEKQKQLYNYEIKQLTQKRIHSKEKQEKILDTKTYMKFMKNIKEDNFQAFMMFFLLYHFPFRNEIRNIYIINLENFNENYNNKKKRQSKPKDKQNIIFHDYTKEKYYIIRNDYKTAKTYGEISVEITKEKHHKLYKYLTIWINGRGTMEYLFSKKDGKSGELFDGAGLSAYLGYQSRKYLDVKLTTTSVFKIVIANFRGDPASTMEFIEEKGDQRGTNVNSLITHYVYKKNSDIEYSDSEEFH